MKEIKATNKEPVRINVFLRDEGVGSRRVIDGYISSGLVSINKKLATLGSKVTHGDSISFKTIAKDLLSPCVTLLPSVASFLLIRTNPLLM